MEKKNKKVKGALTSAFSALCMIMLLLCTMLVPSACSDELTNIRPINDKNDTIQAIRDLYWLSERTGLASVSVKDTLALSEAVFKQTSTFYNEKEGVRLTFNPHAYLNVRLSKQRIDVRTKEELPTTLEKSYIESQTPFKDDVTYGEDVVKIFEFADGQVATVSYGYRYLAAVVGTDTLAVPHVEVELVDFDKQTITSYGDKTETDDPYKSTLAFKATYSIKGTSSTNVTGGAILKPWYHKVVSTTATKVESVDYDGRFIGCPYEAYELKELVKTNKGEFTNTYRVPLSIVITAPNPREQPSLDSLFNSVSVGKITEKQFSQVKNEDGFTVRTMTGTYVSTNTGKKNKTTVESTVSFTYEYPVKFESEYGTYTISPLKMKFEEDEFVVRRVSENAESKLYKSVNTVQGSLGTCSFDLIDEVVNLRFQKDKAPDVVKSDSTYVLKGNGDDYIVDKIITWSDGTKTTSTYSYTGRHEASAQPFGQKRTSSLNWNAKALQRVSQKKDTEEKKFSNVTKFSVVYTTSTWNSAATNGTENGVFAFTEMSPVVTFIDGETTKVFTERKYVLTGVGATVAQNFNQMVVDGVSYKAYAYNYVTRVTWNGTAQPNLVSEGTLLMKADEVGTPQYVPSQTWNGNTVTVKVTKTIPHSATQDEVFVYSKNFTIALGGLTNGKIYADNTSFTTTSNHTETNSMATDSPWTVTTYKRQYSYVVSNGVVKRDDLRAEVTDAVIAFNDGTYQYTFNVRMNVSHAEQLGTSTTSGDYQVTPHVLTVTGSTPDGKSISSKGTTSIYVPLNNEPDPPHLGKPKNFVVTATYDPTSKVTRRAFVFNWDDGVTYAVCDYEKMLPTSGDFMFKVDNYTLYNSVGYDTHNSNHWQPARGTDDSDAIRWYASDGSLMSAIDKALTCKVIGWKNIVDGHYALVIPGYTYTINGYNITVKAPNGQTVTFNSHHN